MRSLVISPLPIVNTEVVVARVISSSPSSPRKTKPSTPRPDNTCAITKCIRSLATPIAAAFGLAGFASGPKILKTVAVASSLRAGAAKRIAGWNTGAKQKPIPNSETVFATLAPSRFMATPSASSKSPAPDFEDAARLPCFTTRAPADAAMIAAVVEIFIVCAPSPPVPTVSTARSEIFIGAQCSYICATRAPTSSAVSPLFFRASKNCLRISLSARSSRTSRIKSCASCGERFNPLSIFAMDEAQSTELI